MDKSIHNPRVFVDRIIDDSYHVVKQVYLGLDNINSINNSLDTINTVANNLEEIQNVQDAADSLNVLNANLDKVLIVQEHVDSIDSLAPYAKDVGTVASNIKHVQDAVVNANKAEEYAEQAYNYKEEAQASAESASKSSENADKANQNSQEILKENKEIGNYLKSNESIYKSIKENADATKLVAGNINSVVNVATDLKGESSSDTSQDLGMIGNDDPSDTTVVTGGNIKKVADDIDSVRTTANNIERIKTIANSIDSLEETTENFNNLLSQTKDSANLAKDWANKTDGIVADDEYSAKYYALKAKENGIDAINSVKDTVFKEIELTKDQALTSIKEQETSSVSSITLKADTYVSEFETQVQEATKQANLAKDYANQASAGQINSDWEETSPDEKSYIKNKPDIYTKTEVDSKLSSGLSAKVDISTYTTDKESFATKTSIADMLTKTEAQESYLSITGKAESAKTADSVAWSNVTGTEKVRTTDTPITMNDFGGSIDLGMIG